MELDPRLKGKTGLEADFVRSRDGAAGDLVGRGVPEREARSADACDFTLRRSVVVDARREAGRAGWSKTGVSALRRDASWSSKV